MIQVFKKIIKKIKKVRIYHLFTYFKLIYYNCSLEMNIELELNQMTYLHSTQILVVRRIHKTKVIIIFNLYTLIFRRICIKSSQIISCEAKLYIVPYRV